MTNEAYKALARKWRPKNFADMVGQRHVVQALENAITQDKMHHAYLFTGTRGVGKTTLARIFAKCLNCNQGEKDKPARPTAKPCGKCAVCKEIDDGRFVDLLEVDAASRTKVDQTRELLDNVPFAPATGKYKVYLIDEVHMFSASSFNALLKTLEEPPPHVKFLLATTDPQKLPVTVLSRCLQLNLKRLIPDDIRKQLKHILTVENIPYEDAALPTLARAADGSMRDALSLLDQAIAFGGGRVTEADIRAMLGTITRDLILDLCEALITNNPARILEIVATMAEYTPDFAGVLADLLSLLHALAVGKAVPEILSSYDDPRQVALVPSVTAEDVQLFYQIALMGQRDLDLAPDPRVGLEMVLLRMLAFRPATHAPTHAHQPRQVPPSKQPTIVDHSSQATTTATAVKAQSTEIVPPPDSTTPPQLNNNEDWHNLVRHLKLKAVAGELANNCQFGAWDGRTIRLNLDSTAASLRSSMAEGRLLKALQQYLGAHIKLEFRVSRGDTETPAQRSDRKRTEQQQDQQNTFMQDPVVRSLQDTFQAEVVPNSVQYVGEEKNGS